MLAVLPASYGWKAGQGTRQQSVQALGGKSDKVRKKRASSETAHNRQGSLVSSNSSRAAWLTDDLVT